MIGGGDEDAGEADRVRGQRIVEELCDADDGDACLSIARREYLAAGESGARHAALVPLFEKACRAGADDACVMLGLIYRQADGVERDDVRATSFMQLACGHGSEDGCFNLGIAYENGKGVATDAARAVALYEEACAANIARACFFLADCARGGVGMRKDEKRATDLYAKACALGEKESCGHH